METTSDVDYGNAF